jgi:hypothetical protein
VIERFTKIWFANQASVRAKFTTAHPDSYKDVVTAVIQVIKEALQDDWEDKPDPQLIHEIDDGDYQGTLVYVIAAEGYQPSTYWYVKVSYGSCSGCDTLQGIREYEDDPPTEKQVDAYMTLALHIVQGLRVMGED